MLNLIEDEFTIKDWTIIMGVLVEKGLTIEREIKNKQHCNSEEVEGLKRQKETIYGLAKKISDNVKGRNHKYQC